MRTFQSSAGGSEFRLPLVISFSVHNRSCAVGGIILSESRCYTTKICKASKSGISLATCLRYLKAKEALSTLSETHENITSGVVACVLPSCVFGFYLYRGDRKATDQPLPLSRKPAPIHRMPADLRLRVWRGDGRRLEVK